MNTPQAISSRARELWVEAKKEDGWPDEMRMAYIMGACDGMSDMAEQVRRLQAESCKIEKKSDDLFKDGRMPNLLHVIRDMK